MRKNVIIEYISDDVFGGVRDLCNHSTEQRKCPTHSMTSTMKHSTENSHAADTTSPADKKTPQRKSSRLYKRKNWASTNFPITQKLHFERGFQFYAIL